MSVTLYPKLEKIEQFKVPLTTGEKELLNQLIELFESENFQERRMEIFVQPNLFFGEPDFVIVEKFSSVWIIEVKDYIRESYKVQVSENIDEWTLANNDQPIPSPFSQVKRYKKDLMSFTDSNLERLADSFTNSAFSRNKYNNLFRTAVYFSNYSNNDIKILKEELQLKTEYNNFNFNYILSHSSKGSVLSDFFERTYTKSYQLTNDQYTSLHSLLNPGEAGINEPLPEFTDESYKEACISIPGRRKIRGAAGSGKTTVLAKRVADCANHRLETGRKILVVTYNITICNYIQDKITAEGRRNLNRLGVRIRHFHSLYHWRKIGRNEWKIESKKDDSYYDAIFIDEGQDFETEWFRRLLDDYLHESENNQAEYVIFADEVQNIYGRFQEEAEVEGRKTTLPVTPVLGNWRTLTERYRLNNPNIDQVATTFENQILERDLVYLNYNLETRQMTLNDNISETPVLYKSIPSHKNAQNIRQYINYLKNVKGAAVNDIVILSGSKQLLRELEWDLRNERIENNLFVNTSKTFVSKEDIDNGVDPNEDKSYKLSFFRNSGPIKFSTVHSFKGWESKYVVLILHESNNEENQNEKYEEIYYVGITRAVDELFIINNNPNFNDFFERMSDNVKIIQ